MPDSNFNTGIDQLLARAITLIPTAGTKELYEISVCLKAIGKTEDTTAETAFVNRFNTLLQASLSTTQKNYIARAIGNMLEADFVDGVDLPSQTSNINKLLQTNGLSLSWVKANLNDINNVNVTSPTTGDTLSIDANSDLVNVVSPTKSFETYADVAGLPVSDTTGKIAYAIAEDSFHYWDGSSWNEISLSSGAASGGVLFTTAGSHTWTVPDGVTSVHVVAIGSGGHGGNKYSASVIFGDTSMGGGGGGGLGWKNNIPVTPGQSYSVVVGAKVSTGFNTTTGASGQDSYFIDATTVMGGGGSGSSNTSGGLGGTYVGDGGGNGGRGGNGMYGSGNTTGAGGSGGGAGGYSGNGGNFGQNGAGGGGGGGKSTALQGAQILPGHGGGGVGIYGEGPSGLTSAGTHTPPTGGSGGGDGTINYTAGAYGGGGGGNYQGQNGWGNAQNSGQSGAGAVRIIWGEGRSFPATNVDLASSTAGETTV